MARQRTITPEKQLLNLIENPKEKGASIIRAYAIKHHTLGFFSLGAWAGKFSFFSDLFKKRFKESSSPVLDVKLVNNFLVMGIMVLVFLFFSNLINGISKSKKIPVLAYSPKEDASNSEVTPALISESRFSAYLDKVKKRDIFKIGGKIVEDGDKPKAPSSRMIEATQHLRLVGISWSADPDAMIEDTRAPRTFFVKRGQMIGLVKVQAIFKDKIVLSYGAEEIELK